MGFMYKGQKIPTGGGTDVTAGDGLSKVDNALNVDNPNRGIMTQVEFDALTEEQKASGTYFVDDGQGGGNTGDVYSTEETRIGTWVDGKPLYRITVSNQFRNTTSQNFYPFIDGTNMILQNAFGKLILGGATVMLPSVENNGRFTFAVEATTKKIGIIGYWNSVNTWTGLLTFEYTKTTD